MDLDFDKEIQSITKQLIEKYGPEKIILFGSAARSDTGPDRDADRFVQIDERFNSGLPPQVQRSSSLPALRSGDSGKNVGG